MMQIQLLTHLNGTIGILLVVLVGDSTIFVSRTVIGMISLQLLFCSSGPRAAAESIGQDDCAMPFGPQSAQDSLDYKWTCSESDSDPRIRIRPASEVFDYNRSLIKTSMAG